MTKYLVTMNTVGYGDFGNPRQELMCKEVDSSELYLLLSDMAAIAESVVLEKPVKHVTITIDRITGDCHDKTLRIND